MTIEIWFCVQQRIILFFGKRANTAYPPIFSGVLANYSETEIVAHMQQMPKETLGSQNEKSINSCLSDGSPGEIRTLVSGSRAEEKSLNQASFVVKDIDWVVSDLWQYCKIEERLSDKVSKDYKNVANRFLLSCNGEISRQAIREFLKPYLEKAPKTYNNIIDALRAFIKRYLQKPELMNGFKHGHVPSNYDKHLPTKEQLKKGFEALDCDQERAVYLFFATAGLRRSEVWNLAKNDVDFETRCVKAKHDTRTKRAGVTFYNKECEEYLSKYLESRRDDNNKLFRINHRQFYLMWKKVSKAADFKITPQVLRRWHSTMLGELMVPDRFVDVFQGRAPRSVLARHYTGKGLTRLERIYSRAGLRVLDSCNFARAN
jgi:integrase